MLGDIEYNCDMAFTKRDLAPLAWLVVAAVLLLSPLPLGTARAHWPALTQTLQDFGHAVIFGWLAHASFASMRHRFALPSRAPYLWVMTGSIAFGAVIELAQPLTGRSASLVDFGYDTLGAALALLLRAGSERASGAGSRAVFALAGAAACILVTPLAFTAAAYVYRSSLMPVLWQEDDRFFARLSRVQGGRFAGLVVEEPAPDWSAWSVLEIDVENPLPRELPIVVRVHDRRHDNSYRDRYNGRFTLQAMARETVRISLEQIRSAPEGRTIDLRAIREIVVFEASGSEHYRMRVHEIRLAQRRT